jgi:hypothetical protein
MGAPGESSCALPPLCPGWLGGHRAASGGGEPGERRRDLELPHDRRPDAVHTRPPRASRGPQACQAFGRNEKAQRSGSETQGSLSREPRQDARTEGVAGPEEKIALPYLRFSRDKRGYENTFVVHTDRRRGKARSRILYWFRTPPGVKVGRAALDESAIKLIEEHNPDVEFDWTRILKGQAGPEQKPGFVERRARPRPGQGMPVMIPDSVEEPTEPGIPEAPEPGSAALIGPDEEDVVSGERGLIPEEQEVVREEQEAIEETSAAHRRLGAEGVLRLRARYAEVLARISERVADPAQQEKLKSDAERLNPDTWVTDDEVREGLEQYEAVFESVRSIVGQRRRPKRPAENPPADVMGPEQDDGSGE